MTTCTCQHPTADHNHTGCTTCQHLNGDAWWCPATRFQLEAAHLEPPTPDRVERCLDELPDLCALLPDALITRTPHGENTRPAPGPKPPVRLDIIDLLDTRSKHDWLDGMEFCDPDRMGVLPFLHGWCRDLEADMLDHSPEPPAELPDPATITGCCRWLTQHLHWAQDRPQWPEIAWGIHTTHRRVKVAVRGVQGRPEPPVPCGRCGEPLTHVEGTMPLWECPNGHQTRVQAVTLRQAARVLGVSKSTLSRWARRRGLLAPISDSPGRRLYDLGQLRSLVAEAKLRHAG